MTERLLGQDHAVVLAWRQVVATPCRCPAAVDLSLYRIVQEALTNIRKHAGDGARATVRLAFQPTEVEIDVTDDGHGPAVTIPAPAVAANGNGLRGIAERVTALGGSVTSGPRAGGGFGIHARLPLAAAPPP